MRKKKKEIDNLIKKLEVEIRRVGSVQNEIYDKVQACVQGESFIDMIIERINRKQLK